MGCTLFFLLQLHFSTITITIFVMLLTFPTSNGDGSHDPYKDCSTLMACGNFTYPFWNDHQRPKFCGHPRFKLKCHETDEYPVLEVDEPPSRHQILASNNFIITIYKIHDSRPEDPHLCPIPFDNNTHLPFEDEKLLSYSSSVEFITLFYDCQSTIAKSPNDSISCRNITAHYLLNSSTSTSCNKNITFPVLKKELDYLKKGNGTLANALMKGFEVDFSREYTEDCLHCERSGGTCGSFGDDFQCFCKDGAYLHPCPKSANTRLILGIAVPVGLFILTALSVGLFWCKKCKFCSQKLLSGTISYYHMGSDLENGSSFFGIPVFSYMELQEATNNFDSDRILGDGGFGIVYHGKLRDGREVAVKRLYERNYKSVGQFMTEVEILTTLKHPNLVTIYGCTSRHSRELLLVYEYIPNGTVADHLHGDRSESTSLTWAIRMRIAIEIAGALSYLHASDIIHRDVKTNNILLDNNFSVKVADFGLSRLFPLDATHVSTAPQGTPGYLDPEYRKYYQVTNKSDVYSFGVVLIELISSLPAIDISRNESEINLSTYAKNKIQQGALDELVDQKLGFESDFKVKRMVTLVAELAFQCLQQEKEIRPCMEKVLETLKRIESVDYEALETEEMSLSFQISKPASEAADSEVEQPLRDAQNPKSSPKSVIGSWASRFTASNTSG